MPTVLESQWMYIHIRSQSYIDGKGVTRFPLYQNIYVWKKCIFENGF